MTFAVTVGPVTDRLYALAQQAVAGVTVNGAQAVASDGPVDELTYGLFVIGIDSPQDEVGQTDGAGLILSTLGMQNQVAENYVIPGYIDVRVAGNTQKDARDVAETIFNRFASALLADPGLGGRLPGGKAEFSAVTSAPSSVGTASEPGRRQLMTFGVRCTSLINPN